MDGTVVVIGAGLAGLSAAGRLRGAGLDVVVVDKGRGVGGRLATRRLGDATVDHGAAELDLVPTPGWTAAGVVAEEEPGRWRGVPAMTALAKHLAAGHDLRLGRPVVAVRPDGDGWRVVFAEGGPDDALSADAVVLTAPVPQDLALLDAGGVGLEPGTRAALEAVTYDPCCVALVPLADPPDGPDGPDGPRVLEGDPVVERVVDHHARGTSAVPAVTVRATASWSAEHLDDEPDAVLGALLDAAGLAGRAVPGAAQLHRWRYARVVAGRPESCLVPGDGCLVLAGDAFGPGDAAGAVVSGAAAAERVIERFGAPG